MTAPTVPLAELATMAKQQLNAGVRAWADALQAVTEDLTTQRPALVDPKVVVEKYFDTARGVLDSQCEAAKTFLANGSEATRTVTEKAAVATKNVAAQAVSVVEVAAEKATAAVKAAAAKAAANG